MITNTHKMRGIMGKSIYYFFWKIEGERWKDGGHVAIYYDYYYCTSIKYSLYCISKENG